MAKKLNILISEENSAPYYQEFPYWLKNFILFILPTLSFLLLCLLMVNINLLKFGSILPNNENERIQSQLREERSALETTLMAVREENMSLRQKNLDLSSYPAATPENDIQRFSFIKLPTSFQDLSGLDSFSISRWQWDIQDSKIRLNFQLNNKTKERVRGFVFLVQYSKGQYSIYPTPAHPLFQRSYLEGTSFSILSFKPIEFLINYEKKKAKLHYNVLIFSIDGDLIHEETFGPYEVNQA